jgi:hypothetical protein
MRITIDVETGNDAMQSRRDVYAVVRELFATKLGEAVLFAGTKLATSEGKVRDVNGNTVGSWKVES